LAFRRTPKGRWSEEGWGYVSVNYITEEQSKARHTFRRQNSGERTPGLSPLHYWREEGSLRHELVDAAPRRQLVEHSAIAWVEWDGMGQVQREGEVNEALMDFMFPLYIRPDMYVRPTLSKLPRPTHHQSRSIYNPSQNVVHISNFLCSSYTPTRSAVTRAAQPKSN
jgi:hypothetical protein